VKAQSGWKQFGIEDFRNLRERYGVNWIVLQQPGVPGLACPYQNRRVLVCKVDGAQVSAASLIVAK
jgi:hypothetical protein